jgi:2-desacetyl-2-hydroxyethyl bacteriochlorophyllide A dehydrogenase
MKAGIFTQPGALHVADVPEPQPGPDDVVIAVRNAGICGTDIHILKGEYEATYPLIPGHEFSGVVAGVGANVRNFAVGDRVTADPNVPCGRCSFCQKNQPNQCRHLRAIGVTGPGGFAQYIAVPEGNVFAIGAIPFAHAALIEPLACVVWGLQQVQIAPADSLLVFGAGPMGCLLLQAARSAGAGRIVAVDTVSSRLNTAAAMGATETLLADGHLAANLRALEPDGFDVVTDATGVPAVISGMFAYARPRGKIWIFGVAPNGAQAEFIPYDVFRKDLKIIGSFAVNRTFPQAIALIASGRITPEPLISHTLDLNEFARGFEIAQHEPSRMKIQFAVG